jgi:hypothetical protein
MAFKFISADERMAAPRHIKGIIFGPHGCGKTTLLTTLEPKSTLFLDLEAGSLSIGDFPVASITLRTWEECRDIACLIGGPNPALRADQPYSQAHYEHVSATTDPAVLEQFSTYFVDSISVASRLAFQWATGQPDAFSEKTGKPDVRGAYGLMGRELIRFFTQAQHAPKNVWLVGGLDEKTDDFNRPVWSPQIEGSKAGLELPGIFDEVITMAVMKTPDGQPYRALVTSKINPWGYPAKDRSGCLEMIEEPHLGKLMAKIAGGNRLDTEKNFNLPEEN